MCHVHVRNLRNSMCLRHARLDQLTKNGPKNDIRVIFSKGNITMEVITQLRSYRISNVALFDYIGSYLAIYVIISTFGGQHKPVYYMAMLPTAILVHVLVKQKTTLTDAFLSNEFNFTKAYVLFLIFWIVYLISIGDYKNSS